MTIKEIMWKLWVYSDESCPCQMGIPCPYGNDCCDNEDIDCLDAILSLVKEK